MKFLLNTLLLVVLTIGFRNIYANDWAQDRERLGTHFLKFLETIYEIALKECTDETRSIVVLGEHLAKSYGKSDSDSKEYGYVTNGSNYTAFRNYTGSQIILLWNRIQNLWLSESGFLAVNPLITDAIRVLAKDINEDTALPDKYKFERLPNLDFLEKICVKYFGVTEEEFLKICPPSPIEEELVEERDRLGTHFLKFLETFEGIVLKASTGKEHEEVEHEQVARRYGKPNLSSDSEEYGYVIHGSNFTAFRDYTRTRIMFLWNRTSIFELGLKQTDLLITNAIRALAKDINEDRALPDKYKYKKLPYRVYFKAICAYIGEKKKNEFLGICPASPPKQ